MTKKLLFTLILLAASCCAQNASYQNIAIGTVNVNSKVLQAIPNASVTVFNCVGGNCTSLIPASLCLSITDALCAQSNVTVADAGGNFKFYILPGRYAITITASGFTTYNYTDVVINAATGDTNGPITGPTANGGLVQTGSTLGMLTSCSTSQGLIWNGTAWACTNITGQSATAQIGDILRFNGTLWSPVNYSQAYEYINAFQGSGSLNAVGLCGASSFGPTFAAHSDVAPTATVGFGETYLSNATASVNTVIGMEACENGSNSETPVLAFYRFSMRAAMGQTGATSVRYWLGLGCWGGSLGNNGPKIVSTTAYANDSPNKTTIGFRYSQGTDTNFKAVVISAGIGQTTIDTGVAEDTSPHLFEFVTNATGTSFTFFIDGNSVGTITTNIPPVGSGGDSLVSPFWTGDNKNTNTQVTLTFYNIMESFK